MRLIQPSFHWPPLTTPSEVVLVTLLQRLVFEATDKEINWIPSIVIYPIIGKDIGRSQMPLRVRLYQSQ